MQTNEITKLVNDTVAECTQFFIAQGWADKKWDAVVRTSFSSHRNRSWGGRRNNRPYVSLALKRYQGTNQADFVEYPSFARDPEIGTVTGNTRLAIKALVIHEMCHAIQYTADSKVYSNLGVHARDSKGHGYLWRTMYRKTRNAVMPKGELPNVIRTGVIESLMARRPDLGIRPIQVTPVAQNTMSRQSALAWIRKEKAQGRANRWIIDTLVSQYGFKKTTATTYTYSA